MRIDGEIEREDREQHQDAAEQSVQKEFNRSIFASRAAPDADQKVHRQQHDFPKNVKEKKIQGTKDSHHAGVEQKKQREVTLDGFFDSKGSEDTEETK